MTEEMSTPLAVRETLASQAAVTRHLQLLLQLDPRLQAVYEVTGEFPPRRHAPGFAGLARIVCGQQLSVKSADAIWSRLQAFQGATTPEGFLALEEEALRKIGLSRNKYQSLNVLARAHVAGDLDLGALEKLAADAAIDELTRHKGVGPWTAEIYLMFCAGHPDIFPAGDLALQKAVGDAFGIAPYPDRKTLTAIAAAWAPYRATAALLFWRFYAARRQREGVLK